MYTSIVTGTDGSATAAEAVRRAIALAAATSAALHIVGAFRPPSRAMTFGPEAGFVAAQGHGGWDAEAHESVQAMLERIAAEDVPAGVKVTLHALPLAPVDALLEVAAAERAELIVVGNRGMSGIRRTLGSVPNAVAHKADCDVLIVATT